MMRWPQTSLNTALGKKLGYADGAYIGQMLSGLRPISEKFVQKVHAVRDFAGTLPRSLRKSLILGARGVFSLRTAKDLLQYLGPIGWHREDEHRAPRLLRSFRKETPVPDGVSARP